MTYKKKELLEIITSLQKVNKIFADKHTLDSQAAEEALVECQKSAIMIGSSIEAYGEPGEEIVHILEDYCENIYQMSISLEDAVQCKKLTKKINKQLFQISSKIRYFLPDNKKVILFLPYKASMWDSMESIWENAVQDENCEAHIVPIPYFEKQFDGTLGKMYYEGGLYPEYVPVMDWSQYDLKEQRPDVIYIHNPYDSWNKVTSIHPDYYIEKLKKYSCQIVYIPYFVTLNYVEEHFCVVPGTLYTDKVIVQTNKIKNIYQKTIRRFEKENELPANHFHENEKFLVYGSPKFDRALHPKKYDHEIPDEWKRIIFRSDGSRKKIILFNTSVQELLLYQEEHLEKIQKVIELFQRDPDIVLLWRPHPLNESTVKAMLPHILEKYLELKHSFKESGNGILDSTANLYRAIAISDAYYGTGGSLLPLYGLTGKPIMKEDTEILDLEKINGYRYASFENAHVEPDGALWFSNIDFNSLFYYNLKSNHLVWKGTFPNETFYRKHNYSKYHRYKNKLIFPPYFGNELAIYDIDTGEFIKIPIELDHLKKPYFYGVAIYGSRFFAFGANTNAVMILELETLEVAYYEEMYKDLKKRFEYTDGIIIGANVISENNICYLFCKRINIVIEFHMDDLTYKFWRVGNRKNRFQSMQKFRNKIYLFPKSDNNIICWDYHKGKEFEVVNKNTTLHLDDAYNCSCEFNDELYLFAFHGNHNAKIPAAKEELEITEENMQIYAEGGPNEIDASIYKNQKISWAYSDADHIYYFSMMNKTLYIKNVRTGELCQRHLLISNEDFHELRKEYMFRYRNDCTTAMQCIYKENANLTLLDYMEWVKANDTLVSQNQKSLFLRDNAENNDNCGILCHKNINLK